MRILNEMRGTPDKGQTGLLHAPTQLSAGRPISRLNARTPSRCAPKRRRSDQSTNLVQVHESVHRLDDLSAGAARRGAIAGEQISSDGASDWRRARSQRRVRG